MKFLSSFTLIAALAVLSGCRSMKVTSTQDPDFDFSKVKSFLWLQPPEEIMEEEDTYMHESLQQSLNNRISSFGLKEVLKTEEADIQLFYYIKLKEHAEYSAIESPKESQVTGGITFGNKGEGWSVNEPSADLTVYAVETGTLTIIVQDPASGKTVWKGVLVTKVDRGVPLEKLEEYFKLVSGKILHDFPLAAK